MNNASLNAPAIRGRKEILAPTRQAFRSASAPTLTIALVNNMPDAELLNTEYQFRNLFLSASNAVGVPVNIRLFAMLEIPRATAGKDYISKHYEDIAVLWHTQIDGLIVTGMEPKAARLDEEPYWRTLSRLVEWSKDNTCSAVWSCLAAHAGVYHLDKIGRQALSQKLSGIFDCATSQTPLLNISPGNWSVPHSRLNGLSEHELESRGYQVMSRSRETGPDVFVKQFASLFVFIQGHPEYDAEALLREYRRDAGRFLRGKRCDYPNIPCNYFDARATARLLAFREKATHTRDAELVADFPVISRKSIRFCWHQRAARFYQAWLEEVLAGHVRKNGSGKLHFQKCAGKAL